MELYTLPWSVWMMVGSVCPLSNPSNILKSADILATRAPAFGQLPGEVLLGEHVEVEGQLEVEYPILRVR